MKKKLLLTLAVLLLMVGSLYGHDMFLKFSNYFLNPNSDATVALIHGTYDQSENVITRDRMQHVQIVGPSSEEVMRPDTTSWWERDNTTYLNFKTGEPGTYVVGVSTLPRFIDLSSEDFNEYLMHDGVLDVLEARKRDGTLGKDARERYSKHVKAIFQVGNAQSDVYSKELGYPIEIIPLQNPYTLSEGDAIEVRVLRAGNQVPNQLVYASYAGYHSHDDEGGHVEAVKTRTNDEGVARIELSQAGRWYIRLIHMVETDEADVDYESNWATLTFEIR